jgi:hypothetical protein
MLLTVLGCMSVSGGATVVQCIKQIQIIHTVSLRDIVGIV